MKKHLPFVLGALFLSASVSAQDKIKDGTISSSSNSPKDGALLDLESNNRALLLTRVSLLATTTWGLNGAAPTEGGYTVYNTSAAITGNSSYPIITGGKGVYYWDGTGWVATKSAAATSYQEPWNVQSTTTPATLNSQNIFQSGTVAIGRNNVYSGATLHVEGAIRGGTNPQGTVGANSIALGFETEASGGSSFAVGNQSTASGLRSVAMGDLNVASGDNSIAFGNATQAVGTRSTAFGNGTKATGINSTSFGAATEARGLRGTAFGYGSISGLNAADATAFGLSSLASGDASTAFGANTAASGDRATAFGASTIASNDRSTAFGNTTVASGPSSTAFGYLSRATDTRATAFGYDTRANGNTSTAFGAETIAGGANSTAFGYQSRANGNTSTAFGSTSIANGDRSTAFGYGATTSADGANAISMGTSTAANHLNALVAGNNVSSSADNQFTARFQGGYRFMTQAQSVSNIGAQLLNSANAWSTMSSVALKENFQPVDSKKVLDKIMNFELSSWNYKGQDKTKLRHYGPMAEDFFEAFGHDGIGVIGVDDSINQADFDGINMIAIQALANENKELVAKNKALEARLEKLEKLILDKK